MAAGTMALGGTGALGGMGAGVGAAGTAQNVGGTSAGGAGGMMTAGVGGGAGVAAAGAGAAGTGAAGVGAGGVGAGTGVAGAGAAGAGAAGTGVAGTGVAGTGVGGTGAAGAGVAGAGVAGAGAAGTGVTREDCGEADEDDVVTIGDSYMRYIVSGIEISLEDVSGRNYRNHAEPGTSVLNGQIPGQYSSAKRGGVPKTVVMTGGGNDIILNAGLQIQCGNFSQQCRDSIDDIHARVTSLLEDMASDGVQDVFIVGYLYSKLQSPPDYMKESQDYGDSFYLNNCLSDGSGLGGIRCHFVHAAALVPEPHPVAFDNIHPTGAGYDTLGELVWDRMQAEGACR
jgi:hypothetical protein